MQADDQGSFWNTQVAQDTLNRVKQLSETKNTIIVLFIHGWHHNADPTDTNFNAFKDALSELYTELGDPQRSTLRNAVTNQPDAQIVGIYVGWRGRSLPQLLDYLTFWGRKPTAERVGSGDVAEFIERLQQIYLKANVGAGRDRPFTGLVTIGHSFGGQVLWKSMSRQLETPLAAAAPCLGNSLYPSRSGTGQPTPLHDPIGTLGDLNILVNPALEAYQFAKVDALYRQLRFPEAQTPQLLVVSSDNDKARSFWFPAARGFSWTYRPTLRPDNDAYQGKLYGKALGEVPAQQTHELKRAPGVEDTLTPAIYETPEKLRTVDFTDITTFDHISLRPTLKVDPQSPDRSPYSPILVVKSGDEIVDGHNGLFGSEGSDFRRFLTKYIAYVEGKRLVLRAGNQLNLQNSNPIAASAASAASVTDALGPKRPRADSKVSVATAAIPRTAEPAPRCRDQPSE
ncbi:MAG: hypothetical protein ABI885_29760 [Gammaproteobacteria bacterium]